MAFPLAVLGLGAGSFCLADWLSNPYLADQLWPADIHQQVVSLLGGDISASPAAARQINLSMSAVLARIVSAVCVLLLSHRIATGRSQASARQLFLARVGITGLSAAVIWMASILAPTAFQQGVYSPLLMLLCGVGLFSTAALWLEAPFATGSGSPRLAWSILLLGTAGWVTLSFVLNERLYALLLIPHGDSAMYEEHLWNVWHGKGFRSYLDQGLFLGEHIQVIHLLLLPLHLCWPSHLLLELAESAALGSCTIPLFLITRRRSDSTAAALLLALAWLLFFPMHFLDIAIDQKTFRPLCLGLPFLFWMIHSAETGRFKTAWICLLLALSAKEDVALITAPVCAVLAWQGRQAGQGAAGLKRWGLATALFSTAWLLLTVLVVIPWFRAGAEVHYSRYFGELGSSPGELIRTTLTQPHLVLAQFFSLRTLVYVLVMLGPLGFWPFRRPMVLSAGLLTFGMLSLLQLGDTDNAGLAPVPYHHFHAPLLPVLFWAASCALTTTDDSRSSRGILPDCPASQALLILACCLTTGITGSLLPAGATFWSQQSAFGYRTLYFPEASDPQGQRRLQRAAMAAEVEQLIPHAARVASTDFIHTRLTHRERSYDYSGYERVVNEQGQRVPADTEYIVLDTGHHYSEIRNADQIPELKDSDEWTLLPDTTDGYFLILQRTTVPMAPESAP